MVNGDGSNGNGAAELTAEDYAQRADEAAQRSARSARDTQASAMRVELVAGRVERELTDVRREQREIRKDMRQGFEALNAVLLTPPQPRAPSAPNLPDFEMSDTGTHALVPADVLDDLLDKRAQREDAQAYRRIGKRLRLLLIAAATGAATLGGEQLLRFVLAHH